MYKNLQKIYSHGVGAAYSFVTLFQAKPKKKHSVPWKKQKLDDKLPRRNHQYQQILPEIMKKYALSSLMWNHVFLFYNAVLIAMVNSFISSQGIFTLAASFTVSMFGSEWETANMCFLSTRTTRGCCSPFGQEKLQKRGGAIFCVCRIHSFRLAKKTSVVPVARLGWRLEQGESPTVKKNCTIPRCISEINSLDLWKFRANCNNSGS